MLRLTRIEYWFAASSRVSVIERMAGDHVVLVARSFAFALCGRMQKITGGRGGVDDGRCSHGTVNGSG